VIVLRAFGQPDLGPIASGYLGLALVGAMFVSIGILASSLTGSQVISAILSIIALLVFGLLLSALAPLVPQPYRQIMIQASVTTHYSDFSQGVVDIVHVIYFLAVTAYALFFTVKILESRRWR
jgi:ABC-2 type transport system permease protein